MQQLDLCVQMILAEWQKQNNRLDKLLETLSEEQWAAETATGRNTGVYLVGHLAAVNDGMLPLLGFGPKLYPALQDIFLTSPDKSGKEQPSLATLTGYWKEINAALTRHMEQLSTNDWFQKHTAVSDEDFATQPHRNRLNLVINRTNHQSYHLGQLEYLKKK
ncbi:MAG TPA: DinB family protein [Chitinophagaceae bacterium]|nr:DinB family protein [Chitinophagaceae bacterium]